MFVSIRKKFKLSLLFLYYFIKINNFFIINIFDLKFII